MLQMEFSKTIVLLSYGVSFLGAYIAICAAEQLRIAYLKKRDVTFFDLLPWLILIGSSLGGVGIWCMHFVGMSAMFLTDNKGNHVPITYNIGVSILSLVTAVVSVIGGVMIASNDRVFAKTRQEILEMLANDFKLKTMQEIKNMSHFQFLWMVIITDLKYLIGGGLCAASGVVLMHYIGMAAIEFEGRIVWHYGVIAASIIIAILASIAAFWILFRLLSIYPNWESLRLISALVMGIAVCGMHYCGMVAASFESSPGNLNQLSWTTSSLSENESLYPVLFAAMLVLWMFAIFIFADLRQKLSTTRLHLQKMMHKHGVTSPSVISGGSKPKLLGGGNSVAPDIVSASGGPVSFHSEVGEHRMPEQVMV